MRIDLVGGSNPFEKYARQIGSFPHVGVKQMFEPPPSYLKSVRISDTVDGPNNHLGWW